MRVEFHSGCFVDLSILPLRSGSHQRNQNEIQSLNEPEIGFTDYIWYNY